MQYQTDRIERRNRQHAFWLALLLHLSLASVLYLFYDGQKQISNIEHPPVMLPVARPNPLP